MHLFGYNDNLYIIILSVWHAFYVLQYIIIIYNNHNDDDDNYNNLIN